MLNTPEVPAPSRRGLYGRILQGGIEPDPRFTLANERTFLAWIRTSLALIAGGIAVEAFMADLFTLELRKSMAVLLLGLGLILGAGSFFRWLKVETSMRQKKALPLPLIAPLLAVGSALVAGTLITFIFIRPV